MANVSVLSALQAGHSSSTVKFAYSAFSTMMPVTVNVNRLATHQPNLEAGSVYSLAPRTPVTCSVIRESKLFPAKGIRYDVIGRLKSYKHVWSSGFRYGLRVFRKEKKT
ncbi:Uncharacterized protein Rs2_37443 [Raphanus sativus]|nr:Uncharacterized protein Rs2_37443 [Raphanus sativus]